MAAPIVFQIESGVLAFSIVDPLEVGYAADWNAPAGATAEEAVIADYDADSDSWSCQVTSGMLTASADQRRRRMCRRRSARRHAPSPPPGRPASRWMSSSSRIRRSGVGPGGDRAVAVPVRERHRRGVLPARVER